MAGCSPRLEIAAALWSVYQRYVGKLNTAETRASFCNDVQAVLGPNQVGQQWIICNDSNNPPEAVAKGELGFHFQYYRRGDVSLENRWPPGREKYISHLDVIYGNEDGLFQAKGGMK